MTADNINSLTLTTTKGTIGGWNISSSYIYKNSVYFGADGSIYNGTKWRLNNDGSGLLADGNIEWDTAGNITAKNAVFTNVRINGSNRNPFILNESYIWADGENSFYNYDNVIAIRGSWGSTVPLPWTLENSGRRIMLINYKWNSVISTGTMSITAPTGQYFYEDGLAKSELNFSYEFVELMGYGDNSTFLGWVVVNRGGMTGSLQYGRESKLLAQGLVTGTSSSASISYSTFDGSTMSVTRLATGKYMVSFSSTWGLNATKAMIMLTGNGYSYGNATAPIKASVYSVGSYYFYVNTSDDSSNSDGSFYFQISNMNGWTV